MAHTTRLNHGQPSRGDPWPDLKAPSGILKQDRDSLRIIECSRRKPLKRSNTRDGGRSGRNHNDSTTIASLPSGQFQCAARIIDNAIDQPMPPKHFPDFITAEYFQQWASGRALGHDESCDHRIALEHGLEGRFGRSQHTDPLVTLKRMAGSIPLLAHGRTPPRRRRP